MTEPHDRNVYILGAGFSAGAGAPLVRDFLDRSREFLDDPRSSLDGTERDQFSEVFKFQRTVKQAREKVVMDLDDIEQLFGLVEISARLGVGGATQVTRDNTVYLIAKTLQLATKWPKWTRRKIGVSVKQQMVPQLQDHRDAFTPGGQGAYFTADIYDYFAALLAGLLDDPERRPERRDSVITFNYDLVLDHALQRVRVVPEYHLEKRFVSGAKDHAEEKPSVSVFKLHGSTNWAVCTKCNERIMVLEQKVTEEPSLLRDMKCDRCNHVAYQPLVVPPSWDKSEYREIINTVWRKAVEELASATRICVIGYSMPEVDAFFKYLLTLSLSENHRLYKFIVVDLTEAAARFGSHVLDLPSDKNDERRIEDERCTTQPKSLEQRYRNLLDPLFQERRFSIHLNGVEIFLQQGGTYAELGRGEGLGGTINLY